MANPQKENGFTPIANEILEALARYPLNGSQHRIIDVIWRYTYGFSRKAHGLSETFISRATGIHRKQVQRELNELITVKVISVIDGATFSSPRKLAFNKDYSKWVVTNKLPGSETEVTANKLLGSQLEAHTGSELVPSPGSELAPQEINNIKKILKKDYSLEIKNFRQRYSDFIDLVDEYLDILRTTRVSGKIPDSVISKIYTEMDKYPPIIVKYACTVIIRNPALHSKKEHYFFGIMRNTPADEAEEKLRKYEATQSDHSKPNDEYMKLKASLDHGSIGI